MSKHTNFGDHAGYTTTTEAPTEGLTPEVDAAHAPDFDPFKYEGPIYADNNALIKNKVIFDILGAKKEWKEFKAESKFQWDVEVRLVRSGDVVIITLSANEERDKAMEAAIKYLESGKELKQYRLIQPGKAMFFRRAAECSD